LTAAGATITALAPGKVVLWGEYAVLAGAPALVMAVDRYARCEIELPLPREESVNERGWRFASSGFVAASSVLELDALTGNTPPAPGSAVTAWHVLKALPCDALPGSAEVRIDTTGFYDAGTKLGLGSSAAVSVALYGGLAALTGSSATFETAAAIHHRMQGNQGSGIDVAAAWFGGSLRFQRVPTGAPEVVAAALPADVTVRFVWAGQPAVTTEHLARFADWRARGATAPLDALMDASAALFAADDWMASMRRYVHRLDALDRAAGLGIYDAAHRALHELAMQHGVVYKPCGAGGGDIGAAFSADPAALDRFIRTARVTGYAPITLETALHGIHVRRD
jgi:phosphomevalonate kinase